MTGKGKVNKKTKASKKPKRMKNQVIFKGGKKYVIYNNKKYLIQTDLSHKDMLIHLLDIIKEIKKANRKRRTTAKKTADTTLSSKPFQNTTQSIAYEAHAEVKKAGKELELKAKAIEDKIEKEQKLLELKAKDIEDKVTNEKNLLQLEYIRLGKEILEKERKVVEHVNNQYQLLLQGSITAPQYRKQVNQSTIRLENFNDQISEWEDQKFINTGEAKNLRETIEKGLDLMAKRDKELVESAARERKLQDDLERERLAKEQERKEKEEQLKINKKIEKQHDNSRQVEMMRIEFNKLPKDSVEKLMKENGLSVRKDNANGVGNSAKKKTEMVDEIVADPKLRAKYKYMFPTTAPVPTTKKAKATKSDDADEPAKVPESASSSPSKSAETTSTTDTTRVFSATPIKSATTKKTKSKTPKKNSKTSGTPSKNNEINVDDLDKEDEFEDLDEAVEPDPNEDGNGGYMKGGLNTLQIMNLMNKKYSKKGFSGVLSLDQVKSVKINPNKINAFVVNTEPSTVKNGHWVGLIIKPEVVEYYDSFGQEPSTKMMTNIKKLLKANNIGGLMQMKINRVQYQSVDTANCGYFVISFLGERMNGKTFRQATGFDDVDNSVKGEKNIEKLKKKIKQFGYLKL